jgi:hypothetical protein
LLTKNRYWRHRLNFYYKNSRAIHNLLIKLDSPIISLLRNSGNDAWLYNRCYSSKNGYNTPNKKKRGYMRKIHTLSMVVTALVASFALSACSLFEAKKEVAARHTDRNAARAYTAQMTETGEKKWVKVTPQMANTTAPAPQSLGDIEPAAGGNATPVNTGASAMGYVPGMGYTEENK